MTSPAVESASAGTRTRIAAGIAVSLLVLGSIALAVAGMSASWCASCHAMRPFASSLRRTPHKDVSCVGCHGSGPAAYAGVTAREATAMFPRFAASLGSAEVGGPRSVVSDAPCRACHARVLEPGVVTARGLRISHSTCAGAKGCVSCHDTTAHGESTRAARGFTMDACVRCHDGTIASDACDLCHAEKLAADRVTRGPWAVTHGKDWRSTHGLGDLSTCKLCHAPQECRGCHRIDLPHPESFPRTHGTEALRVRAECVKCHDEKTFCTACHGMPMPHPAGFLAGHPHVAKGFVDPRCAHCHPRETCDACHEAHTHPGSTDGTLGGKALPKAVAR